MSKKDKNFIKYDDSNILSKLRQSICLTVDEAKQVRIAIAFARMKTPSLRYGEELSELIETVTNRIKQAEKANADN